jgi:carboxymethylenebutenolidase
MIGLSERSDLPTLQTGVPMYETNMYEGMLAETVSIGGAHGDQVRAYFARPLGPGRYPGIVLIHHRLG